MQKESHHNSSFYLLWNLMNSHSGAPGDHTVILLNRSLFCQSISNSNDQIFPFTWMPNRMIQLIDHMIPQTVAVPGSSLVVKIESLAQLIKMGFILRFSWNYDTKKHQNNLFKISSSAMWHDSCASGWMCTMDSNTFEIFVWLESVFMI